MKITSFTISWGASELTFERLHLDIGPVWAAIDAAGNIWRANEASISLPVIHEVLPDTPLFIMIRNHGPDTREHAREARSASL